MTFAAIENEYTGPVLEDGKVTVQFMKDLLKWYKEEKKLHRKYAYKILLDVKTWFMAQPSLVNIEVPEDKEFTICGDIHGQFYDLLNIFQLNGLPSETNPYVSFFFRRFHILLIHEERPNSYSTFVYFLTITLSFSMEISLIEAPFQ